MIKKAIHLPSPASIWERREYPDQIETESRRSPSKLSTLFCALKLPQQGACAQPPREGLMGGLLCDLSMEEARGGRRDLPLP